MITINKPADLNYKEGSSLTLPLTITDVSATRRLEITIVFKHNDSNTIQGLVKGGGGLTLDSYLNTSDVPYVYTTSNLAARTMLLPSMPGFLHNKIYEVKFVFDTKGERTIYVDGVKVATDNQIASTPMTVTGFGDVNNNLFKGQLYYMHINYDGVEREYGVKPGQFYRPAKKVPTINLINPNVEKWTVASADTLWTETSTTKRLRLAERITVTPNTQYKVKIDGEYRVYMRNFSSQSYEISNSGWVFDGYVFTTPSNMTSVGVLVARKDDGVITLDELAIAKPMLAQGLYTVNIPYEEVGKKATLVPKKNLVQESKFTKTFSGTNASGNQAPSILAANIPVKPNTTYTIKIMCSTSVFTHRVITQLSQYAVATHNSLYSQAVSTGGGRELSIPSSLVFSFTTTSSERFVSLTTGNNASGTFPNEVSYDEVQLEEGSVATEFESYQLVNKKTVSFIKRAPYKNYPFFYKRESVELFNGIQYGNNNPRVKNDGILIEEGTVNLFAGKSIFSNNGTTSLDLGDRVRFAGSTDGNSSGGYITSIPVKANTAYTISARFVESESAKDKLNFLAEQSGSSTIRRKPFKMGDRYYMTFTTDASVTKVNVCFYLSGGKIGDYFELYKDWQIEEKAFPTSYTERERKADIAYVPSAISNTLIDTVKGSLEVKFHLEDLTIGKQRSFFLFDSNADRFFTNYDMAYDKFQVSVNKLGLLTFNSSLIQNDNTLLVEWDGTTLKATFNGVTLQRTGTANINNIIGQLSFGVRYSLDVVPLNDTLKSFVIKDRNGNVTFQI
ncbi:hypothetical protein ACFX4N_23625 [Priestia sp. YIM B13551]|uniref:hypothetical protein n=1 Tax=Priestia sp. YIM B13551 TaxID=3366306 RepID=UPI00366D2754